MGNSNPRRLLLFRGLGRPIPHLDNPSVRIIGSLFAKGTGFVTHSGRIAVHSEQTISSTFLGMSGRSRMPMTALDWMFRRRSVTILHCSRRTELIGNSAEWAIFRKGHGAATGIAILSWLR